MSQQRQTLTGAVEAANDKGIKVDGRWLNYSQFHEVERPQVGQTVRLEIEKDRFINALRVVDGATLDAEEGAIAWPDVAPSAPPIPAEDDLDPATFGYRQEQQAFDRAASRFSGSGAAPRPVAVKPVPAPKPANTATLKAAALAAAAHFHSGKPDADEDAVFGTAYRFLAWLTDGDEA